VPVRKITDRVHWICSLDAERRLFDELIPLPSGTTYNSYLVRGSVKTALIDGADPGFTDELIGNLDRLGTDRIDYLITNHAEQDHSGSLPVLLDRFPGSRIVATPKCVSFLADMLHVPADRVTAVEDGAILDLGDGELSFTHFPWVHWPETMVTFYKRDRILFPCDLFGSHLAVFDVLPADDPVLLAEAKRYYATIMMPVRSAFAGKLPLLDGLDLEYIAPSHGPVLREPAKMIATYKRWMSDKPENLAVILYVSMHDSTRHMVMRLVSALANRGVRTEVFPLAVGDAGRIAAALVDAATIVLASPTVLGGPHPLAANAAFLANLLKPKARFAAVIGSYEWGGHMVEQVKSLIPSLKCELLGPVLVKGLPRQEDYASLDRLAEEIAARHGTI